MDCGRQDSWSRGKGSCGNNDCYTPPSFKEKGTDLFINDRQAVSSRIPLIADDPATASLALLGLANSETKRAEKLCGLDSSNHCSGRMGTDPNTAPMGTMD